jgi:hypothetical protein
MMMQVRFSFTIMKWIAHFQEGFGKSAEESFLTVASLHSSS